MFKNRAAQVTFVKTPKADSPEPPKTRRTLNDAEINTIKSVGKGVGLFLVGTAVTLKFTDAICTIAVNIAPKN